MTRNDEGEIDMNSANFDNKPSHLLQDFAALEYILLGDLRDLLEDPADETTSKWLLVVLDALLDTLPREFALREAGGYLSEVLEQFPNWADQVDQLHREQSALYEKLGQLRRQVSADNSYSELADGLRSDLRDWMQSFVAHHRHERRMVQTAFNLEVGIGD
jgi:hypothetical protein